MNYLTQSVGKNLKQARKSENLTQKDVAALLNMPNSNTADTKQAQSN